MATILGQVLRTLRNGLFDEPREAGSSGGREESQKERLSSEIGANA